MKILPYPPLVKGGWGDFHINPQQIVIEKGNLKAYQSIVSFDDGRTFLIRAIVDDTITPAVVVTAYRTSKTRKYWRPA
jgi:hypothetical protein